MSDFSFDHFKNTLSASLPFSCVYSAEAREDEPSVLAWCAENFGADAVEFHLDSDTLSVHDDRRWTWGRGVIYFKNETDAVFFKLRFG